MNKYDTETGNSPLIIKKNLYCLLYVIGTIKYCISESMQDLIVLRKWNKMCIFLQLTILFMLLNTLTVAWQTFWKLFCVHNVYYEAQGHWLYCYSNPIIAICQSSSCLQHIQIYLQTFIFLCNTDTWTIISLLNLS